MATPAPSPAASHRPAAGRSAAATFFQPRATRACASASARMRVAGQPGASSVRGNRRRRSAVVGGADVEHRQLHRIGRGQQPGCRQVGHQRGGAGLLGRGGQRPSGGGGIGHRHHLSAARLRAGGVQRAAGLLQRHLPAHRPPGRSGGPARRARRALRVQPRVVCRGQQQGLEGGGGRGQQPRHSNGGQRRTSLDHHHRCAAPAPP